MQRIIGAVQVAQRDQKNVQTAAPNKIDVWFALTNSSDWSAVQLARGGGA
jgi:hypothetical protein